jgi:hypothetical protein
LDNVKGDNVLEKVFNDIEMDGLMNEPVAQLRFENQFDNDKLDKEIEEAGGVQSG